MTITPEYQVFVTSIADLNVGDRVLRRATAPKTGKVSVDIVSRIQEAPPSRKKMVAGQNKARRGKYLEIVWNDNPKNLSFHHSNDELLVVTNFIANKGRTSMWSSRKRVVWQ